MNISFREIDRSNYNECIELTVTKEQEHFVAPNMYSLVQGAYEPYIYPLGIYMEERMVGFILYDYDEEIKGWSMSRFMIDKNYQNQGIGKVALRKFISFFHARYKDEKLYTSAEVDNYVVISLYESFGFVKGETFTYKIKDRTYTEYRMVLP